MLSNKKEIKPWEERKHEPNLCFSVTLWRLFIRFYKFSIGICCLKSKGWFQLTFKTLVYLWRKNELAFRLRIFLSVVIRVTCFLQVIVPGNLGFHFKVEFQTIISYLLRFSPHNTPHTHTGVLTHFQSTLSFLHSMNASYPVFQRELLPYFSFFVLSIISQHEVGLPRPLCFNEVEAREWARCTCLFWLSLFSASLFAISLVTHYITHLNYDDSAKRGQRLILIWAKMYFKSSPWLGVLVMLLKVRS